MTVSSRGAPSRRAIRVTAAIITLVTLGVTSGQSAERPPANARAADALALQPPSRGRDARLERWARKATLGELVWMLRHGPERLGGAEAPFVEAALKLTSPRRATLRQRLIQRLSLADRRRGRSRLAELAPSPTGLPSHPRASVFRVGALLPDSGAYEAESADLRAGLEIGLAWQARTRPPIEVTAWPTGDDDPVRAVDALSAAAPSAGVIVGEAVERSTVALAAGARMAGLPVVVPAAPSGAGAIGGTGAFRLGPGDVQRGLGLARSALAGRPRRLGILVSSRDENGGLLSGFEAGARAQGVSPAWRHVYPAGVMDFKALAKTIAAERVELLFWDGDPRELEALARQLASERVRVELCGGAQLDPERHHAAARGLFENARFAGEDWVLAPWARAVLDSALAARDSSTASGAHVRGWLAARLVAIGLSNGAISPEELTEAIASQADPGPGPERGQIRWTAAEATLPIYVVRNGRPVIAP